MSVKRKRTSSKGGPTTKRIKYSSSYTGYYGRVSKKGGEAKFFETDVSLTPTTSGVIQNSINLIPQGVTESTRVGRKCTITKIGLRGVAEIFGDATAGANQWRIIVYLDKQANGAAAGVTDILESADDKAFNNLSNSQRFVTLKDWYFRTEAGAYDGTDYNPYGRALKWHKKCSIPLEFSSTTGAITELRSNNIGILAIMEQASPGTVRLSLAARIRFTDN